MPIRRPKVRVTTWRPVCKCSKSNGRPRRISLCCCCDLQNVRPVPSRTSRQAHKFALEKFASDLLPIVDSLERGPRAVEPDDESIRPMREASS